MDSTDSADASPVSDLPPAADPTAADPTAADPPATDPGADVGRGFREIQRSSDERLSDAEDDPATVFPPLDGDAIVLTGPTASGKSGVALEVAEALGAEIISIDSIAVYRGMDIGTAKASPAERLRVPHHLLDVACPTESYSVATYLSDAWRAIEEIRGRGRIPLLVGGTPMYLKGLLHGFDPGPPADWEFRRAVEADLQRYGAAALHARLWQVDPLSAHRLAPSDTRRVTRALEVAFLTGQPLSHRQQQYDHPAAQPRVQAFAIQWPRPLLHRRIAERVQKMFELGLVDEVIRLLEHPRPLSRTASVAVGYREVLSLLRGELDLPQTIEAVIAHTRQLARRQETWLRSLQGLQTFEVDEEADLERLPARILERLKLT